MAVMPKRRYLSPRLQPGKARRPGVLQGKKDLDPGVGRHLRGDDEGTVDVG